MKKTSLLVSGNTRRGELCQKLESTETLNTKFWQGVSGTRDVRSEQAYFKFENSESQSDSEQDNKLALKLVDQLSPSDHEVCLSSPILLRNIFYNKNNIVTFI